ncbi:cation transporter [Agromyces sp. LHK192]|uniref:cation transporter n=1 Tax=Agromyces sp. LHK192 TaxID=2498704 RepID=UPI00196A203D|nr:cation transporter [Agromyces sp. LHK192]
MRISADGRFDLGLTGVGPAAAGGGCCGGAGGCSCGAGGHTGAGARARVLAELDDRVVAEYDLTGLTGEQCVERVTEAFVVLDGVQTVDVWLVAGGSSTVRVASDELLDPEAVAAAVDEAGYALAG